MDIRARYDDPAVEELARSIYALFPRCMKCGEAIPTFEEADVRVLTNRVVHRGPCDHGQKSDEHG
ncbi:MAG TPA: hypothetical protein VN706_10700 [Gemmatimonadaceae bacterium]|nr:hypothetical protein [Gemmatimonadaceae bacterium]